jgi:hypothetical protein
MFAILKLILVEKGKGMLVLLTKASLKLNFLDFTTERERAMIETSNGEE